MADADKNILITPARGSTADPKIVFTGTNATPTTLRVLDDASLSIESDKGQLFAVTNTLTGSLFSVNDVSGVPVIDANEDGTIQLSPYNGKILVNQATATAGVTAAAYINGAVRIGDQDGFTIPGTDGASGQVLSTNGSGSLTWVDQSGGGGADNATALFYAIAFGQF